jgi:hypothetical protein
LLLAFDRRQGFGCHIFDVCQMVAPPPNKALSFDRAFANRRQRNRIYLFIGWI